MRVLLRDLDSGLFYRAEGVWVKSPLEAMNFQNPESVIEAGKSTGKTNLEVFVADDRGRPKWGRRIENGATGDGDRTTDHGTTDEDNGPGDHRGQDN